MTLGIDKRVGAGVGHGQGTSAGVFQGKVLVGELLAVDGLASGALYFTVSVLAFVRDVLTVYSSPPDLDSTCIVVGEVTALAHEAGDDAVEAGALVSVALLAGAEGAEVLGRLGDDVLAELHDDLAEGL